MKFCVSLILLCVFYSCEKSKVIPHPEHEEWGKYSPSKFNFPTTFKNFPQVPEPNWNVTTVEGVALGRKLYYDNILSTNGRSCSTCHLQEIGFSTHIDGPNGMSVPAHVNLAWNSNYGWLGLEQALDSVALADLEEDNIFLKANNELILEKFKIHKDYPRMFWKAFGIEIIKITTAERKKYISYALAQFMRTQISNNSKFDQYLRGESQLTSDEISGFSIFMDENKGDCFHCHGDGYNPMWRDNLLHNNGLDATHSGNNLGLYSITGIESDKGKFRTPTLRNIQLTGPYMHDGRYATLEEVVNFYSTGLNHSPSIDPLMKKVDQGGAQLNPTEKMQLITFLKTLTDYTFLTNAAFSKPE